MYIPLQVHSRLLVYPTPLRWFPAHVSRFNSVCFALQDVSTQKTLQMNGLLTMYRTMMDRHTDVRTLMIL